MGAEGILARRLGSDQHAMKLACSDNSCSTGKDAFEDGVVCDDVQGVLETVVVLMMMYLTHCKLFR